MSNGPAPDIRLRVDGLTLAFGERVVQRDISFSVRRGSVFAVMGGSGCGKSTLLRALVGLMRPAGGTILVDGEDYWGGLRGASCRDRPPFRRAVPERGALELDDGGRKRRPAAADVHAP